MPFSGQLGTPNSELGNIVLGAGAGSQAPNTQSISAFDSGVGLDSAAPSGAAFYTIAELSVGSDVGSTAARMSASDTGTASDLASGGLASTPINASDTAAGVDTASFLDVTPACNATSGSLQSPAQRLGPEYFLPHWTSANAERLGNLFALCQWGAEREVQWKAQTARGVAGRYLSSARSLEPLYEWRVNFIPPTDREMTVTFQATTFSGSVQGTARRATSPFDYDTAVEPVWYQDPSTRVVRLRGLFLHSIQRYTSGTVYTICGAGTNAYLGVVPDTGYFYRRSPANVWEWISPESDRFAPNQVTLPGSGTWLIAFGSNVDLANLQVTGSCNFSWAGGQSITLPLIFTPVPNLFDGYGALFGLPRFLQPIESNYSYKGRLLSLIQSPPDATVDGVIRGIGSRLGSVSKLRWDGVSPVTLDAGGTQKITSIKIVEFNQFYEIDDQLLPTPGNTLYYSTFSNWRQNAIVFVNGLPTSSYTVSGNLVSFFQPVTGTVEAIYSVQTYSLAVGSNGYITGITPGQGVVSGNYTVLITKAVNAHTVDDLNYQKTNLLDASGLPNALFVEIASRLTENNPTSFGRARWGSNANWFEQSDQKPEISRLPIPLDSNT